MHQIISASFDNTFHAQSACLALRSLGIPCRHQFGRRAIHAPAPCPRPPHHSVVSVRESAAVPHPAAVLNLLPLPRQTGKARQIIRAWGGHEI